MKKKILLLSVAVALALLCAALAVFLGTARSQTVGICYRENTNDENSPFRAALEQGLRDRGYQVLTLDADLDQARQLEQLEQLAQRKCNLLIVEPVMTSAQAELLTALERTGLPAVILGSPREEQQNPKLSWVHDAAQAAGAMLGRLVETLPAGGDLNGDGAVSYFLLQGPQDHILDGVYATAARQALPEACQPLQRSHGEFSYEDGLRLGKQILSEFGRDIEVILCTHEELARGAAQAVTDGGWQVGQDMYILCLGAEQAVQSLYSQGFLQGGVYVPVEARTQAVLDAVEALYREEPGTVTQVSALQIPEA